MIITMLGTSGSGKTVYMSAMSALFYNGGSVKHFSLSDRDRIIESGDPSNPFNQLDNSDNFIYKTLSELNNLYEKGCFPDGTSQSVFLPLVLKYDNEVVFDIDWIDYRGGALSELAKGEDTIETAKILYTLLNSDVVLVFVDASAVNYYKKNIPGARKRVGADVISKLLGCVIEKKKHVDIIFLLSKFDSSNIDQVNDYRKLKEKVGELYSKFLSQTKTTISNYQVIAIGAVGYGNVNTTHTWVDNGGGRILTVSNILSNIEEMQPYNIDYSFFKALLLCIDSEINGLNHRTEELEKEISRLEEKLGPIAKYIDILFGSKKRRRIRDDEKEKDYNKNEFERLKNYRDLIQNILNDYPDDPNNRRQKQED